VSISRRMAVALTQSWLLASCGFAHQGRSSRWAAFIVFCRTGLAGASPAQGWSASPWRSPLRADFRYSKNCASGKTGVWGM